MRNTPFLEKFNGLNKQNVGWKRWIYGELDAKRVILQDNDDELAVWVYDENLLSVRMHDHRETLLCLMSKLIALWFDWSDFMLY